MYVFIYLHHSLVRAEYSDFASTNAAQVSLGRSLRRTVDMFNTPRDLVAENDRRMELALDLMEDTEPSAV